MAKIEKGGEISELITCVSGIIFSKNMPHLKGKGSTVSELRIRNEWELQSSDLAKY